jgi:arylsulfatase
MSPPLFRFLGQGIILSLLSFAFDQAHSLEPKATKPNIVIFFTDDQGYNDVGCFGSPLIETPNLDRMAAEGLRLTSFYAQPVCGVSRAALMTGSYPIRVGEPANRKNLHTVLHPKEITLAEVLRDAGYATGMIGKWHLAGSGRGNSWNRDLLPNAQGFDYWFGSPSHNGTTRLVPEGKGHTELMRNGGIVDHEVDQKEMGELTRLYTEEAISFLRGVETKQPFFLYLAHTMPHVPINASAEFLGTSKRGLYGDVVSELDWSLGQVVNELKSLGIDENTIIIFCSDNGPWIEDHLTGEGGTDSHCGSADPLRGAKMMTWEGGIRVPAIIRWPARIKAGRESDELIATIDLYPTLARLAGVKPTREHVIDGVDQSRFLIGETDRSAREHFFFYAGTHLHAVRSGNWKLVASREAKPDHLGWWARMIDEVPETALFHLKNDPGETTNVADDHPEEVARLQGLLTGARAELGDWDRIGSGARFFDDGPRLTAKELTARAVTKKNQPKPYPVKEDEFDPLGDLRFDFESGDLQGWRVTKGAFEHLVSSAISLPRRPGQPFMRQGNFHLSTIATANDERINEAQTGVIESPPFLIRGDRVAFLLSGGGPDTAVALCDAETGEEILKTGGPEGPRMERIVLEFPITHRGKPVFLRLIDEASSNWGHLCFDDFSADGVLLKP